MTWTIDWLKVWMTCIACMKIDNLNDSGDDMDNWLTKKNDDVDSLHIKIDNLSDPIVGFCFIRVIDIRHQNFYEVGPLKGSTLFFTVKYICSYTRQTNSNFNFRTLLQWMPSLFVKGMLRAHKFHIAPTCLARKMLLFQLGLNLTGESYKCRIM